MWQPKKLLPCYICKENGRRHQILTQCDSYGHISYGVHDYNLCYWCFKSIMLICDDTPIDYLVSDGYHMDCQETASFYDDSDRWTRKELNRFPRYIDEHEIRHCVKIMAGQSTWTPGPKIFLDYRINLVDRVTIRHKHCNTITTIKLLAKENSYFKYLPTEILSIIIDML